MMKTTPRFVRDSSQYWHKPKISRDEGKVKGQTHLYVTLEVRSAHDLFAVTFMVFSDARFDVFNTSFHGQWCAKYYFQNSILFWKYKIVFYFVFSKYFFQVFCYFQNAFFENTFCKGQTKGKLISDSMAILRSCFTVGYLQQSRDYLAVPVLLAQLNAIVCDQNCLKNFCFSKWMHMRVKSEWTWLEPRCIM